MRSEIAVDVAAPAALVFALARDVERWSALLPHYRRSRRMGVGEEGRPVVSFVAVRSVGPMGLVGVPVAWRARTWSEPATCRLRFLHVGGASRGMDVTWRMEPTSSGCRVTIAHEFPAPRLWAAFIDRTFTRPIAGRTLATFRAVAEALAKSEAAPPTNPST
jgi:ribosome-associated toxin RatA of RatAB toxin-antitoxin module